MVGGAFHAAVLFLVAGGLQIVFGVQKIINLACGSFYAIGAYFGITALAWAFRLHVPVFAYIPVLVGSGLVLAAVLGPVVERVLRLIYRRDEHFQLLLTFALVLIFEDLIRMIWGASPRQTENIYQAFGEIHLSSGMTIPTYNLIVIGVAIALSLVLGWVLQSTSARSFAPPLKMRLCAKRSASTSPRSTWWCSRSASLWERPAARWLCRRRQLSLDMGVELIVDAFAVVVIGGLGSMPGALVGALIVGFVRAAAIWVYPEFEVLAIYVLVIAVLILRPRGLLGKVT